MAQSPIYNHWLPIFTVLLGTGCRIGELIGLRWCDCDFDNNVISINHNLIYRQQDNGKCEMHITTPKTKAGTRTIPMLSEVRKALFTERKNQMQKGFSDCEIDGYSNFVFLNREGYVHNPMTLNRAMGENVVGYEKGRRRLIPSSLNFSQICQRISVEESYFVEYNIYEILLDFDMISAELS